MKDGNKESAKELSAIFRLTFTASISITLILFGLIARNQIEANKKIELSIILFIISAIINIYLFLLIVPKIYKEEENIIYTTSVYWTARLAMVAFISAAVILVFGFFA